MGSPQSGREAGSRPKAPGRRAAAKHWIPILVFLLPAGLLFGIWRRSESFERQGLQVKTALTAEQVALRLKGCVESQLEDVHLLKVFWEQGRIRGEPEFRTFAEEIQHHASGLLATNWIDPQGVIRWVVPAEPNQAALGRDLTRNPVAGRILARARQTGEFQITPPLDLYQGGLGFAAYYPLNRGGRLEGFLNGVFRTTPMIEDCLSLGATENFFFQIEDGEETIYPPQEETEYAGTGMQVSHEIRLFDRIWKVTLTPRPSLVVAAFSSTDEWVFGIGLFLALVLSLLSWRTIRSRERLEQRTAELQAIYQAYPDLQFRVGSNGTVLGFQAGKGTFPMRTKDPVVGRPIGSLFPAKVADRLARAFQEVREKDGPVSFEYDILRDGERRSFEARVLPLEEEERIVIARDITERRQAGAILHYTRFAVDHASIPIYWVRSDGFFAYANHAACQTLGYSFEEFLRMSVSDIDPDFPKGVWKEHWEKLKKKVSTTLESHHRTRDGRVFPVEITTNFIRYGEEETIWAFAMDISERENAARILRSSEARARKIIEFCPLPLWVADTRGRILDANDAWVELTGYSRREALAGKLDWRDLTAPGFKHLDERAIEEIRRTGSHEPFEKEILRKDGRRVPVEVGAAFLAAPEEIGIGYLIDLRDRKNAEKEQARLETQLRNAHKMEAVGLLASGIAHDFNNILTVVLGNVELLRQQEQESGGPEALESECLEEIEAAGLRASVLVSRLLSFGREPVHRAEVLDAGALVRDTEKMLRWLVREDVLFEVRADLEPMFVRADPGRVQQVIVNLISNACDAMPQGGRLRLECRHVELDEEHAARFFEARRGPHVLISVSDDGHGMDPATLERIFEPFFSTKPPGKGTGLGLASVYGMVQEAEGHVTVESRAGKGSVFRVFLPAVDAQPAEHAAAELPLKAGAGEVVLVAEDESPVRRITCAALISAGYRVLEAEDGKKALELARSFEGRIDLLLTDVVMPGVNGWQLAGEMEKTRPGLGVLFLSGYPRDEIQIPGGAPRHVDLLTKPFDAATLLRRVRQTLDSRRIVSRGR